MIVLDENIAQESVLSSLRQWYRGRVCSIRELRPATIIKDEAIPALLILQRQPTFVTTNVTDFWQRIAADDRYCTVCLPLPNERQDEIPVLLRDLFRLEPFKTKAARMGKIVRTGATEVLFYQAGATMVQSLTWSQRRKR